MNAMNGSVGMRASWDDNVNIFAQKSFSFKQFFSHKKYKIFTVGKNTNSTQFRENIVALTRVRGGWKGK